MSEHNNDGRQPSPLNPQSLRLEDLARILSAAGSSPVTVEMLRADVANGAPTNADATLNLVHYGSWLVREMSRGNRS